MEKKLLTYGQAIELLEQGECITKEEWDNEKIFIFKNYYNNFVESEEKYRIAITTENCKIKTWTASSLDIVSDDYYVVENIYCIV